MSRLFNYPAESPDQIQKRLDKLLLEASKNYKAGQKHSIDRNLKYVSSLCNTRITAKDIEELISKVLDEASDNDKTHLNFFKMCTSMKIEDKRMIEFLENTGY